MSKLGVLLIVFAILRVETVKQIVHDDGNFKIIFKKIEFKFVNVLFCQCPNQTIR